MKRKPYLLLALYFLAAVLAASCGGRLKEPVVGVEYVKYHKTGSDVFGFSLNVLSSDEIIDVEFVRFEGENTDSQNLGIQLEDETFDDVAAMPGYKGVYLRMLGFTCVTKAKNVTIDSVVLKIDGVEKTYALSSPIRHANDVSVYESSHVMVRNSPNYISTDSFYDTLYPFSFYTGETIYVTGFAFSDFLAPVSTHLLLRSGAEGEDPVETDAGVLDELIPYEVPAETSFVISTFILFADQDTGTTADNVYVNGILEYKLDPNAPETYTLYLDLVCQSVSGSVEDAQNVIDLMTGEKE